MDERKRQGEVSGGAFDRSGESIESGERVTGVKKMLQVQHDQ